MSSSTSRAIPLVRTLVLDFSPTRISELWHAACEMLPAIEVRMYCRTHRDLDQKTTLAERYDVVIVDAVDQARWFPRLQKVAVTSLLESTIVIAGVAPLESVQSTLLRTGYVDVVCVQDELARTVVSSTIKAYLRQLRNQRIDLPPDVAAPIQRALI